MTGLYMYLVIFKLIGIFGAQYVPPHIFSYSYILESCVFSQEWEDQYFQIVSATDNTK